MRTQKHEWSCTNSVSLAIRLRLHFPRPIMEPKQLAPSAGLLGWRNEAVDGHDAWAWIYPQMSSSELSPWWMPGPFIWPVT